MTGYEEFQRIMANIEYFKKNGITRDPRYIKDKDGNAIFEDIFGDIFNKK